MIPSDPSLWKKQWSLVSSAGRKWKWSRGSSRYRNWASGEPKEGGDCVTISSVTKKMSAQDCNARFPFVCLRENLILIKENKTWEEALEHCRASNQELISVQPGEDHRRVRGHIMEAETDKVGSPPCEPGHARDFILSKVCFPRHSCLVGWGGGGRSWTRYK